MIQPFERIEGLSTMKYRATFVSDSIKKLLEDRERYEIFIEIDPWENLVSFSCECKGFKYGKNKKLCKHISNDSETHPGILQVLKQWGEIQKVPTIEQDE